MMYKDSYGNISCSDEITCPYCGMEYSDSYEYFPDNPDGEVSWDMECEECGKKFHVAFDIYNQSEGFECSKICRSHRYVFKGDTYKDHDVKFSISTTSNFYRCKKCGKIKFVYTKPDGTEYTKKELSDWKKEKKKSDFIKNHPECNKHDGVKVVEVSTRDTEIYIRTEIPEGNEQLFKSINRRMKAIGFDVYISERYKKDYKVLSRWHRDLKRGWLQCESEFSRNGIEYKFFQDVYIENSNGGRYDFNKYQKMDTRMKTEFRSIRKFILDYVSGICTVKEKPVQIHDWHGYVNVPEDCKTPGKFIIDHNEKDFDSRYREGLDQNENPVHSGDFLAAYDRHGRLWCGRMYNRCGTYKFMVHNDRTYSLFMLRECFPLTTDTPRKIRPKDSKSRLERLLQEKIKERDFLKCAALQKEIERMDGKEAETE